MINKELDNLTNLFNSIENERQNGLVVPIYDGGLTQTIVYFNKKYNISIGNVFNLKGNNILKKRFLDIPGNTLLEICNNSFGNMSSKPELWTDKKNDMFIETYLKKYYFNNEFYDFESVMNDFRSIKTNENMPKKNTYGAKISDVPIDPDPRLNTPEWISSLPLLLLGVLALKEKPSLGLKNQSNLQTYTVYINKIVDDFISGYKNKKSPDYFFVLWVNQLINKDSTSIKNSYYDVVNNLLKEYTTNGNNIIKLDYGNNSLTDFHYNLMCFGIIKDYFLKVDNQLYFFQRSMKSEKFTNLNMIEGFEDNNENKKNKKNTKNDGKKETKKSNKKKREVSTSKFLLYCLIFGIIVLLGTVSIIIFWKIIINVYNKYSLKKMK
jgi:hypothetical protein